MRLKFGGLFRNFFLSPCDFFQIFSSRFGSGIRGIHEIGGGRYLKYRPPPFPTKRRSGDGDFLALPFLLVSLPRGLPVLPSTILVLRDVPR